ncbi:MAG TPA: hypothetical protein VGH12_09335 [Steroidobacteraceae bacterium]
MPRLLLLRGMGGKSSGEFFVLTPKGAEELRNRNHQLDATAKNILQLIDEGVATAEALLERSMFPHNAVIDGLRRLLSNKLVVAAADGGAAAQQAPGKSGRPARQELRLKFGVSPTQTRFALSNFCMDQLGPEERYLVDAVSLCADVMTLQEVLNSIRAEVDERHPERLAALFDCVREINETDDTASSPTSARPAGGRPAASTPAPSKPPPSRPAAQPATSKPVWDKTAFDQKPVSGGASAAEQMRLEPGISLAQARFTLSEFCLNQFGVRGQELVDAVNHCRDVSGLQKVLNLVRTEVLNHHRDRLPALAACVREINETAS